LDPDILSVKYKKSMNDRESSLSNSGLTHAQANDRLHTDGYNELPSQKDKNSLSVLLMVLSEPMLVLLLIAGLLYLVLGEIQDTLLLSSFIVFVIGITFYQERKTEKALHALKNLTSPRALVIRDGEEIHIPGREVVVGDIVIVKEGDRIPADAYVLEEDNLQTDESMLTGESLAVGKNVWNRSHELQNDEEKKKVTVFSGTLVVSGWATLQVYAIGVSTQMGAIGKSLVTIIDEKTLLHKETSVIVRYAAIFGILLCVFVVVLWAITHGNWIEGLLIGLTLSMSMLPEEFPVVLTIFFALGAWRLSKKHVLTRTPAVIETLGATTILCVDKTGTLTQNKMQLSRIYCKGIVTELHKNELLEVDNKTVLQYAFLASETHPFDPLEKEIHRVMNETKGIDGLLKRVHVHAIPLSKEILAVTHIWKEEGSENFIVSVKGAPEAILDLCSLNDEEKTNVHAQVSNMAQDGLRVLGVAHARVNEIPSQMLVKNNHLTFLGLIGFVDPIRESVKDALVSTYKAGIRVMMITGDFPGTATAIAKQIGLRQPNQIITGQEIRLLTFEDLCTRMRSVSICARVIPEQKLAIVNALKANGEIVVMTGDGVNDAPALKSAHIGIAMGERGTDVARESADLVLTNDDFASIVGAVRTGRKIYENIKKAMAYIVAVHIPIAGMATIPIILGFPVVLMPAHIAFLELIIDPACSTVFEAEHAESSIMDHPPRSIKARIFSRSLLTLSVLQGLSVLSVTLFMYFGARYIGRSDNEVRTITFITMVSAYLMLIAVNLSWTNVITSLVRKSTKAFRIIVIGVTVLLFVVLGYQPLLEIFHFSRLQGFDYGISITAGFVCLLWFEGLKVVNRKHNTFIIE
jgi:P-type Ca2+ transporter type 2C